MKKIFDRRLFVVVLITSILLVLACIYLLDARVALSVNSLLYAHPYLRRSVNKIPNLLPVAVYVGTAGMWVVYLMLRRSGNSSYAPFLKLTMIVVPVAFLLKMFLQYVFGRTNIQVWLIKGGEMEFSFFSPLSNYPCFPSGHMTVFTAFVIAVWLYYPRCRPFVVASLPILGTALVVTNKHYLGDVIAGFFCGLLVTTITSHLIAKAESANFFPDSTSSL